MIPCGVSTSNYSLTPHSYSCQLSYCTSILYCAFPLYLCGFPFWGPPISHCPLFWSEYSASVPTPSSPVRVFLLLVYIDFGGYVVHYPGLLNVLLRLGGCLDFVCRRWPFSTRYVRNFQFPTLRSSYGGIRVLVKSLSRCRFGYWIFAIVRRRCLFCLLWWVRLHLAVMMRH